MRWRGQGILVGLVLLAAATYGWQWKSVSTMAERLQVSALPIDRYTATVNDFYAEHERFPEPNEISFPSARNDLVRSATLGKNGELTFELSAWRVFGGHVKTTMAPSLMPGLEPGSVRLSYVCVDTQPAEFAAIVCSRNGTVTRTALMQENAEFQASQRDGREASEERARSVQRVQAVGTDCDRFVAQARDGLEQCVARADEQLGQQFASVVKERFENSPRLRPEVIASSPEVLDAFNKECTSEWAVTVAQVKSANAEAGKCFTELE